MSRWKNYCQQIQKDTLFLLFAVAYLMLFRITLILLFQDKITTDVSFSHIIEVLLHGGAFDFSVAAYFVLVPFLTNSILNAFGVFRFQTRIRRSFAILFIVLSSIAFIVSIEYFKEYNNQFDHFLFLILYDDQTAVFYTTLEHYHLIEYTLLGFILIPLLVWLFNKTQSIKQSSFIENISKLVWQIVTVILILGFFVSAMRGSLQKRPAIRKWAGISQDPFLNKTVMNPFIQLKYALQDFNELNKIRNKNNPFSGEEPMRSIAKSFFKTDTNHHFISDYLKQESQLESPNNYDHVFLIIMESLDSWPFKNAYADLHIVDSLKQIATEGQFFPNTISASRSTMNSVAAMVSGLPYFGVNISQIITQAPKTSLVSYFKNNGYRTRFFYGGFSSWQNIENFMRGQKTDDVYTAPVMETDSEDGIWGVEDDVLFNYSLKRLKDHPKSFNVLLTTSYHPPFSVDVYSKGFPLKDIPESMKKYVSGDITLKQLGHIWYSTQAVAAFIRSAKAAHPNSLFIVTGDHYGRRFLNQKPSVEESSFVPIIVFGEHISPTAPDSAIVSHYDIFPTLVNLNTTKGRTFSSFGQSLYEPRKATTFGYTEAAYNETLYSKEQLNALELTEDEQILKDQFTRRNALAWYYTMKGDSIVAKE